VGFGVDTVITRKNKVYLDGELEVILSVVPTVSNIEFLSKLLGRSARSIEVVYQIAFQSGPFGKNNDIQVEKILKAKKRVGIAIGRKGK
jgi:hypothetical protein